MLLTWRWYVTQDYSETRADRRMARLAAIAYNSSRGKHQQVMLESDMLLYKPRPTVSVGMSHADWRGWKAMLTTGRRAVQ